MKRTPDTVLRVTTKDWIYTIRDDYFSDAAIDSNALYYKLSTHFLELEEGTKLMFLVNYGAMGHYIAGYGTVISEFESDNLQADYAKYGKAMGIPSIEAMNELRGYCGCVQLTDVKFFGTFGVALKTINEELDKMNLHSEEIETGFTQKNNCNAVFEAYQKCIANGRYS